jgi:hypothetical protein
MCFVVVVMSIQKEIVWVDQTARINVAIEIHIEAPPKAR